MKRILSQIFVVAALLLFGIQSLQAGAMGLMEKKHNWSGFYVGGDVGGQWANTSAPITVVTLLFNGPFLQPMKVHPSSLEGGGQVGFNRQDNHLLLGAEINVNALNLNKSLLLTRAVSPFVIRDEFTVSNTVQSTLVGKVGYVHDNWLFYGIGGLGLANVQLTADFVSETINGITYPALYTQTRNTLIGAIGGLGVEYALTNNWRVGLEGRYSDYIHQRYELGQFGAFSSSATTFIYVPTVAELHMRAGEVMFKLNYQFDEFSF